MVNDFAIGWGFSASTSWGFQTSNASGSCGPSSGDEEEQSQLVWSEAARKCEQKDILPLTIFWLNMSRKVETD
jgi:hypothetical protein